MSAFTDNLPDHLRRAGVAYVVSELVSVGTDERIVLLRAHTWAVMQGLPIETPEDHLAAVEDAVAYREEHEEDVAEFLRLRDVGRGGEV